MNPYHLGEVIGPELLKREFKELCLLNIHLFFENNELMLLFYKKVALDSIRFNDMIYSTLNQYVQRYVPKYIGNFSKAGITGDLFFGVDDNGLIEGIPFSGSIDVNIIKKMFINAISNSRGVRILDEDNCEYDDSIVDYYYSNLNINIYDLNLPNTKSIDFKRNVLKQTSELSELENKNQILSNSWKIYHILNTQWQQKLSKYTGKLLNYLTNNEMRLEVINYVANDFKSNDSYDQSKLGDILEFFSQDSSYYMDLSFTVDYIEEIIKNPYSPIKWLIAYKDHMLIKIKQTKPVPPSQKPDTGLYLKFCNNVSNINTFLMTSNSDIKFYLIKISVPNLKSGYLEYRYNSLSPWQSRKRINTSYGPSCI
jgi:hypothetical protein